MSDRTSYIWAYPKPRVCLYNDYNHGRGIRVESFVIDTHWPVVHTGQFAQYTAVGCCKCDRHGSVAADASIEEYILRLCCDRQHMTEGLLLIKTRPPTDCEDKHILDLS